MKEKQAKGGMSKNAFGGHHRIDQIDIQSVMAGASGHQKLIAASIQDALNNYWIFALSPSNGSTADEFWWAYRYFFEVRSDKPETWNPDREIYQTSEDQKTMVPITLTDEEMIRGCFDVHYAMAGLDRFWRVEYSLDHVLRGRMLRVKDNLSQIRTTLDKMRARDYAKVPNGADLLLNLDTTNDEALASILIRPENPRLLANLIYCPWNKKNRRSYRLHKPRVIKVPKPRVSSRADWKLPIYDPETLAMEQRQEAIQQLRQEHDEAMDNHYRMMSLADEAAALIKRGEAGESQSVLMPMIADLLSRAEAAGVAA